MALCPVQGRPSAAAHGPAREPDAERREPRGQPQRQLGRHAAPDARDGDVRQPDGAEGPGPQGRLGQLGNGWVKAGMRRENVYFFRADFWV